MGRPRMEGIVYFSMDVDFKTHPKVKKIIAAYKDKGYTVTTELLAFIYKEGGYFIEWNEDNQLLFASEVDFCADLPFCQELVDFLLKVKFFDQEKYADYGILTSRRCQKTYLIVTRKRTPKGTILPEYLIPPKENPRLKHEFPAEETLLTPEENTQSKVKESIGNNIKKEAVISYFTLRGRRIDQDVIDYLSGTLSVRFEATLMNQGMGVDKATIKDLFRQEYAFHDFEDDNHMINSLKTIITKVKNGGKPKPRQPVMVSAPQVKSRAIKSDEELFKHGN